MALATGSRLGPYEIVGAIGAGGMGEVYRAHDARLKRDVALKVLPDMLAADTERAARFQREAELLATLTHPNIAGIYGLEESPGPDARAGSTRALVMELVEGETLADRIARGPIPVEEALPLARQLAEALDYAHEHGVLHRDLKPANIKVTPDGQVKVLDFGLAKAMAPNAEPAAGALANSPTITNPAMTAAGTLLGTAAYMSPEQARGQPVDKRADIWAFGCVLYEMLSGTRAFDGDTISDMLAAVLKSEPGLDRLPANIPPGVRTLLAHCLQKNPRHRLRDIGDARLVLDAPTAPLSASTLAAPTSSLWRLIVPWGVAAAGLVIGATALMPRAEQNRVTSAPLMRIEASLGADAAIEGDIGPAAVLSPDGSLLAFVARPPGRAPYVFVRRMEELAAVELPGTEGARDPFFSPDGQWVAFSAGGKLKKVPVAGGTVVTLGDASNTRGAWWSDDGRIVFNPIPAGGVPLHVVSSAGGVPERLTTLGDGEATQRWPQLIRDGQVLLYTTSKNLGQYNDGEIVVQILPSGPRRTVVRGYFGRYVPSGHLTFVREGRLFAAAFDVERLELTGSPVPVLEQLMTGPTTGGAQFAFSNAGTAVYRVGPGVVRTMAWIDRAGTSSPLPFAAADWGNIRFSPDGQRLALDMRDGQQTDIRVFDWTRGGASTQLTFDPAEDWSPVWTPDGRSLVYRSARDRAFNLYWHRADGSGSAERVTTSPNPQIAYSWHPSGKLLAFVETSPTTNTDIMLLPVDAATGRTLGAPTVFLNTPASEGTPAFSPDGRWIAYTSTDSGRTGVFVRPFPGPGGQWSIAPDGLHPTWSLRRRELLFFGPDQRVMVSAYTVEGDSFRHDAPRPWSPVRLHTSTRGLGGGVDGLAFALHPDGDRIVGAVVSDAEVEARDNRVLLLFNFFDELRRVAVRKE